MLDCHFCFFLVTAGAYVHWCLPLWRLCGLCFCTNYQYNNLPGFRLQRWVGGLVCFFLHTSSCNCPRKPFAVTRRSRRALHSEGAPHARAGFVQSLSAALGSGLLQAPLVASWLSFHGSHTKDTASALHSLLPVCNSVPFCSCTACSRELPHLLPPSGLGVCLFRGTGAGLRRPLMCCVQVRV